MQIFLPVLSATDKRYLFYFNEQKCTLSSFTGASLKHNISIDIQYYSFTFIDMNKILQDFTSQRSLVKGTLICKYILM